MSELVSQRPPDVTVDGTVQYRFAGVYSFGRAYSQASSKQVVSLPTNGCRLSGLAISHIPKLMAWEGALGVVPPECDGMVVSPGFRCSPSTLMKFCLNCWTSTSARPRSGLGWQN